MTETPASGQEMDDDTTAVLVAEKYPVYLRKPSDGQVMALIMFAFVDPQDGLTSIANQVVGLTEIMDSLCMEPSETDDPEATTVRHLYRLMCRGDLQLEDYLGPAIALVEKWSDQQQIEENRADRRAAKKAPAKVAVARPGRTRR
jgi:hypothetical protein